VGLADVADDGLERTDELVDAFRLEGLA